MSTDPSLRIRPDPRKPPLRSTTKPAVPAKSLIVTVPSTVTNPSTASVASGATDSVRVLPHGERVAYGQQRVLADGDVGVEDGVVDRRSEAEDVEGIAVDLDGGEPELLGLALEPAPREDERVLQTAPAEHPGLGAVERDGTDLVARVGVALDLAGQYLGTEPVEVRARRHGERDRARAPAPRTVCVELHVAVDDDDLAAVVHVEVEATRHEERTEPGLADRSVVVEGARERVDELDLLSAVVVPGPRSRVLDRRRVTEQEDQGRSR